MSSYGTEYNDQQYVVPIEQSTHNTKHLKWYIYAFSEHTYLLNIMTSVINTPCTCTRKSYKKQTFKIKKCLNLHQ